jgi:hypothetical protein
MGRYDIYTCQTKQQRRKLNSKLFDYLKSCCYKSELLWSLNRNTFWPVNRSGTIIETGIIEEKTHLVFSRKNMTKTDHFLMVCVHDMTGKLLAVRWSKNKTQNTDVWLKKTLMNSARFLWSEICFKWLLSLSNFH